MGQILGCVMVPQSTVSIRELWGKFDSVLNPGCHCVPWCIGKRIVGHLSLRLQQIDICCKTKTKDDVFVDVVASVQYRALAEKASDAFYELTNPKVQIQTYAFDVICASIPNVVWADAHKKKNEIAKAVNEELEKAMSRYGYEIVETLILDIEPDPRVKRAMNEFNAVKCDAESKYFAGVGIARQRKAIVDGLRDNVLALSEGVPDTSAADAMDMVLVTQYYDNMKDIGAQSKSSSVIFPHGPGAVTDVAAQIKGHVDKKE